MRYYNFIAAYSSTHHRRFFFFSGKVSLIVITIQQNQSLKGVGPILVMEVVTTAMVDSTARVTAALSLPT
uniref:Uncharacterized protein n=1 Tax=Octopus bimaculoides TaxID=37653 RepID=A0A0L8GL58_OCTBM